MKFLLPLRHGLRSARRQPGLTFLLYLASLLPALLPAYLAWTDLAPELGDSLFADGALEGQRFAVWADYARADGSDFGLVAATLLVLVVVVFVVQVLVAAGIVEALLQREHHREHPFLLGIGRHGWRFVRSTFWFLGLAGVVAALFLAGMEGTETLAEEMRDGRYQLWGWVVVMAVTALLFAAVSLAYDLSRVACAAHGGGRTFVAYFKALGHVLRHPLILLPLWLGFVLPVVVLHGAYLAGRMEWAPGGWGGIVVVVAAQQLVFLLAAFFRVGLWGGLVGYHQAIGEPDWGGRRVAP